jgi:nucleoid-associated protein YgaU
VKVYGDGSDANGRKIFEANRDAIGHDPSMLRLGQILQIPKLTSIAIDRPRSHYLRQHKQ